MGLFHVGGQDLGVLDASGESLALLFVLVVLVNDSEAEETAEVKQWTGRRQERKDRNPEKSHSFSLAPMKKECECEMAPKHSVSIIGGSML